MTPNNYLVRKSSKPDTVSISKADLRTLLEVLNATTIPVNINTMAQLVDLNNRLVPLIRE